MKIRLQLAKLFRLTSREWRDLFAAQGAIFSAQLSVWLRRRGNLVSAENNTEEIAQAGPTVGGAFILLGGASRVTPAAAWVTRLGAAMIIPVMLGAIVMVHWGQWNFLPSQTHPIGGMEFQVVLLLVSLYFVAKGNTT